MLFFLLIFVVNLSLLLFNKKIAELINLFDYPDKIRKFHKSNVPLTGGIMMIINTCLILSITLFNDQLNLDGIIFGSDKDLKIFLISTIIFFFIGFLDDKYTISATKRLLLILILLIPIIYFSDDLMIYHINFSFNENTYVLSKYVSIFWTILCFLLFINAVNMFDGINYQVALYFIYLSLFFLFNSYFNIFFLSILISLLFFLYLNHKNNSFLGDSGTYVLAFIFGYFFVKLYNQSIDIKVDHIVLFMLIPGIDLMRLFIKRLSQNKNPFSSDRNHIHHILFMKFGLIKTNLIIQSLIIIPSIFGYYYGFTVLFLMTQLIIYFYLIYSKD
jgi:UDP-GlcNAc:undecaprenyl-phosphate GlcNAc-1-phosphate transferase|tara:strand:- start:12127 stop:13119 length:993 start_codon:yes stop_codon:yes gene_type:complete